jgi:hypothetical protein
VTNLLGGEKERERRWGSAIRGRKERKVGYWKRGKKVIERRKEGC